jgi:hypothetical protein
MTPEPLQPMALKKPRGRAALAAAIVLLGLGAGYFGLTRTQADARPGAWVRLHKASLLGWSKTIYTKSFRPQESGERLFLYDNPFLETAANLDFFVQYDSNRGGVQRLVLELGGITYHIHKRNAPLPRMRRGSRSPAHSDRPLPDPVSPMKPAEPASSPASLFKDYAIRDAVKREYLQSEEKGTPLIKRGLEIAEKRLAEARLFFQKDVVRFQARAAAGPLRKPR